MSDVTMLCHTRLLHTSKSVLSLLLFLSKHACSQLLSCLALFITRQMTLFHHDIMEDTLFMTSSCEPKNQRSI